jgi:hypothetical protein
MWVMKYFRKHPDLLLIANYPSTAKRVRRIRQTTPQELSKILVQTIAAKLKGRKILLLTDASGDKPHAGYITRTSWTVGNPITLRHLASRLLYNHQTDTICILYHANLFGLVPTILVLPSILLTLRLTRKRLIIVFLTIPRVSPHPTLAQALVYFLRVLFQSILSLIASSVITTETSHAIRSLKERHNVGKIITDELFPSPIKNLGLTHYLHPDTQIKSVD